MFGKRRKRKEGDESVYDEKERRATARFYAVFLSVVVLLFLFFNFWKSSFSFVIVSGNSMDKTLHNGEYLLSTEVIYPEHEVKRGDIIVVRVSDIPEWQRENMGKPQERQTHFLIKRLIAMEGDIVRCHKGEMEICYAGTWNEETSYDEYPFVPLDEPYAYYDESEGGKNAPCNTFEYTVGEGEIFFLGDNRNHSKDSRYLQDGYSQLEDRLYQITDITATVSDWSVAHQKGLQKWLVEVPDKIKKILTKPFKKLKG